MALSDVQAGRTGEYLLAVYAMLTTGGELVPFQVDADDDHRDLNRLTSRARARSGREVELHFRAYPDRDDAFASVRHSTKEMGPRLLEVIAALPPSARPLPGARLVMTKR
jgi:hypothetical protein